MTPQEKKLYDELKSEVKKANQRLVRLEREFGKESWASKKLRNKLDSELIGAWTDSSRIKLNKSMNLTQLRAVAKATRQFLNSKTSTVSGVKKQIKAIKKGFQKSFDISEEEAEVIFEAMEEDIIQYAYRYIEPSEFWDVIEEAKELNYSEEKFIDSFARHANIIPDDDLKEKLMLIYERYV